MRKQGLDKLFVECETHMWRVTERPLPTGVRIDGGSDWYVLHRRFVEYAMAGDDLVHGLQAFWNNALLPCEVTTLWVPAGNLKKAIYFPKK